MKKLITDLVELEDFFNKIDICRQEKAIIKLHPNGFLQLPLDKKDKRAASLQLHIWHPTLERRGDKRFQIHDHAFDIESFVIIGGLYDVTYLVSEAVDGTYIVFQGDTTGQMKSTRKRAIVSASKRRGVFEGESYVIKKGDFHSSNPARPFTATLIRKTSIEMDYLSKLVAPSDYENPLIEVDRNIDQIHAWNLVDQVVEIIKKKL